MKKFSLQAFNLPDGSVEVFDYVRNQHYFTAKDDKCLKDAGFFVSPDKCKGFGGMAKVEYVNGKAKMTALGRSAVLNVPKPLKGYACSLTGYGMWFVLYLQDCTRITVDFYEHAAMENGVRILCYE